VPKNATLRLENFLPYLVNRVGVALVERYLREGLKAHKLTIDMWRVLAALADNGGQRQIDLAAATSIETSTVSRLVTRLVRLGLVTRGRSETSSREVIVALSATGRALVKKLAPVALRLEREAASGLSPKEVKLLKVMLRRIYRNLAAPKRRR
jgi:DNA-binding MarR family transcriptional regulator